MGANDHLVNNHRETFLQQAKVPEEADISYFAPFMNEKSISDGEGVKLFRLNTGKEIRGEWKSSRQGTMFEFTPKHKLGKNETYRIVVSTDVTNKAGTRLAKEIVSDFHVSE